jgi:hypothetical protein
MKVQERLAPPLPIPWAGERDNDSLSDLFKHK